MPKADNYYGKPLKLSPREAEILKWTACGKTSGEISKLLLISEDTVNTHVRSACLKLDAVNKTHAATIALVHGVIQLGPSPDLVIPLSTLLGLSKHLPQVSRSHTPKPKRQADG